MFGSNQRPPMPSFAATYLPFFAAKSVCIGVYPWLKTGSVAAPLLQACPCPFIQHPAGTGQGTHSAGPSGQPIPGVIGLALTDGAVLYSSRRKQSFSLR